jgi:arsenate reductase
MSRNKKILFLCTGNSCRSQMAEAWTRHLRNNEYEAYSAGITPKKLDPRAVKAMAEVGIDISMQKSKDIDSLGAMEFDYVITLCENAKESCPYYPAKTQLIHHEFDDPPSMAQNAKNEDNAMEHYRRVRDEIRAFVLELP